MRRRPLDVTALPHGRLHVGIDGGVTTAIAIYSSEARKIVHTHSGTFWDAIDMLSALRQIASPDMPTIWLENPEAISSLYGARGKDSTMSAKLKMAQDVGRVKAFTRLIADYCERHDFTVNRIPPGGRKWTAEDLKAITGFEDPTNQHVRDAIKMCYQR